MQVSRRSSFALVGGLIAAAAGCRRSDTPSAADGDGTAAVQRFSYGPHPSQFAELSLPPGAGPAPVVVVIHGGFWRTNYGLDLGRPLAADLVGRGWAALNVEYRRVGSSAVDGGGGWPQTGDDVAAAVDALATGGRRLAGSRLDLGRVVSLGHSAGGQLAGWLGARDDAAVPVTGVVAQAGVLDLRGAAVAQLGGGAVQQLLGGEPDTAPTAYAQASPIERVPLGVPSVCVHGRVDPVVPIDQSERFVAAARAAGDDSELSAFNGGHFEPISVNSAAWPLCVDAIVGLFGR